MSRGSVQIYFLTDLKKVDAPTLLELVRGMNLTPLIMMIDGWMLRDGLDTSSLTLDGFEAYDLFPEGLAGFLVIKPRSQSSRVEVWPCAVSKRERLMNAWGQSRVFFSSSQPELSGNIGDYQRRTWRAYLGMGKLRLAEGDANM